MNASDTLRQQLCSVTKEQFINKVVEAIKRNGYYAMAYDNNEHTHFDSGFYSTADMNRCLDWAKEQGFRVETKRSYYGQKEHYITL